MDDIYARYNGGGFIFGIRAKDLSRAEFDALDDEQQAQVLSSSIYTILAPATSGKAGKKTDPAPTPPTDATADSGDTVKEL